MSTLKKILSLTLALAMLMSVSVFADFTDKAGIDSGAKAAVELLTATNIIKGIENEDGTMSFNPTGTIKRAEAAKMIYVLHNKGVDDKATIWEDAVTFEDCKGHWAAGYIAYCEAKNLISGRTETSFDPEAPVTGIELAKMLLTVAGYKSDVEGYTGASWEKNVAADAEAAGLFAGVKFAITQPAPRQWAAKMFANAFEADCAIYIGDYRVEGMGTTQTVKAKFLGLTTGKYVVVATETASILGVAKADKGYTKLILASKLTAGSFTNADVKTVKYVVDNALVGQQVTLAENTSKVFGIVSTGKTISGVLYTNKNSSTATDGRANKWTVKVGDTLLTEKAEGTTKINPITSGSVDLERIEGILEANRTSVEYIAFDFDGDKDIDYTYSNVTKYGTVGTISTASTTKGDFTITGNSESKAVDVSNTAAFTVEGTMKKDIVAKWTVDGMTGHVTVAPADVVVGKFSAVSGTKYTVGGQQYEISVDELTNGADWLENYSTNLNKTAQLYTDGKYILKAFEFGSDAAVTVLPSNLAMVIDGAYTETPKFDEFGNEVDANEDGVQDIDILYKVKVLLADGTVAIFNYDKSDNGSSYFGYNALFTSSGMDSAIKYQVFEYKLDSDGNIYFKKSFTAVEDVDFFEGVYGAYDAGKVASYNYGKKVFTVDSTFAMATENTLVFAEHKYTSGSTTKTEYKVVKMADIKDESATYTVIALTDETLPEALLVVAKIGNDTSSEDTPYVIVTSDPVRVKEGTKHYVYFDAFNFKTGAVAQFKAEGGLYDGADANDIAKKGLFQLKIVNGIVTVASTAKQTWVEDNAGWELGKVQAVATGIVLIDGNLYETTGTSSEKDFTSTAKIVLKDGDTYTLGSLSDLAVAKTGKNNVIYQLNAGGDKIANLIIDIDGDLAVQMDDSTPAQPLYLIK